ncbi:MAG TPA: helix-turn-helix domain-containing protein [Phenylobacterium sp.]|uniref:TetR/AcrR family transcriptional regulator n=1 Tax=Phenylobacterium sp. TaxID=1871053 RepID=UPI002B4AA416|nr:helix-turn-helix domain-containing protein [Phenylobacterium sp.]HKR88405.1 helix-turn-helix domain-containing protein [Phenylobacterium sp.]
MSESNAPDARPYHHGDLRRALVEAARRLLETEGAAAMSLRAVAREAGVSPAAPYHHFKDKGELMAAVASEGWSLLSATMLRIATENPDDALAAAVTYVTFARSRPALYRVMFDSARQRESLPFVGITDPNSPYAWVREGLAQARQDGGMMDFELMIAASWCASHGLAEMAGFKQFDHLKETLGGDTPFLRALLTRMGLETRKR